MGKKSEEALLRAFRHLDERTRRCVLIFVQQQAIKSVSARPYLELVHDAAQILPLRRASGEV
jgi:hypothetical protein